MSKKIIDTEVSENNVAEKLDFNGKTEEELREISKTLQTQLQQYQTMATKAQGALEVMLQLIPKEGVEEMIAEEADNSSNGEVVEG